MTRPVTVLVAIPILCLFAGCGAKSNDSNASVAATSSSPAAGASKFDAGPRAGEQPIDETRVEAGERLFKDKGCSACHAFGTKLSGPDLNGVTMRRTAQWMENQILHPEVMTKEDPISHGLMGVYALQMPNQGLTADQARSVIEYLKHRNAEESEHAASSAEKEERR